MNLSSPLPDAACIRGTATASPWQRLAVRVYGGASARSNIRTDTLEMDLEAG